MTWCLVRDVHRSDKTTTLYLQDPAFQRQPCLSFSWALIPASRTSALSSQKLASRWGFFCRHTFKPLKYVWAVLPPIRGHLNHPSGFLGYEEAARGEKKTFSPHEALPNSWRRITLEKLIFKQLWRRFVDLRGAGWDHPLPSAVFWLKAANGQLDGPWSCTLTQLQKYLHFIITLHFSLLLTGLPSAHSRVSKPVSHPFTPAVVCSHLTLSSVSINKYFSQHI